jgi:hypothetical protein
VFDCSSGFTEDCIQVEVYRQGWLADELLFNSQMEQPDWNSMDRQQQQQRLQTKHVPDGSSSSRIVLTSSPTNASQQHSSQIHLPQQLQLQQLHQAAIAGPSMDCQEPTVKTCALPLQIASPRLPKAQPTPSYLLLPPTSTAQAGSISSSSAAQHADTVPAGADSRASAVGADSRITAVGADSRTTAVGADSRTTAVGSANGGRDTRQALAPVTVSRSGQAGSTPELLLSVWREQKPTAVQEGGWLQGCSYYSVSQPGATQLAASCQANPGRFPSRPTEPPEGHPIVLDNSRPWTRRCHTATTRGTVIT